MKMIKLLLLIVEFKKKNPMQKDKNSHKCMTYIFLIPRVNIFFYSIKKKDKIIGQWLEFFFYFECNLIIYYFSN
jgi:hypothetical protein